MEWKISRSAKWRDCSNSENELVVETVSSTVETDSPEVAADVVYQELEVAAGDELKPEASLVDELAGNGWRTDFAAAIANDFTLRARLAAAAAAFIRETALSGKTGSLNIDVPDTFVLRQPETEQPELLEKKIVIEAV